MLRVENLETVYHNVIAAVRGSSLAVDAGAMVALLGANGAGKTTIMRSITGVLKSLDGAITRGNIFLEQEPLRGLDPAQIVQRGISLVPEGRRVFEDLSVEENLRVGAFVRSARERGEDIERVCSLFPRLKKLWRQRAGYLSGGEQQMLAIGRALMARPKLLLLDEPSMGLAPMVVEEIYDLLRQLNRRDGVACLVAEQNAQLVLRYADYGYVMENGKVVLDGTPAALLSNDDVQEFYLGVTAEGAVKSYRDVKSYKRRKRWLS